MAEIGSVIDNRYEILKLIGQGGMSKVYLALDKSLNKLWAIKEIKLKNNKNGSISAEPALSEANLLKKIDYPMFVKIIDIIYSNNIIYIIQEKKKKKNLDIILNEEGVQPQELVIQWGIKLCEALGYLHSLKPAIIYRDMKPANIILTPSGEIKIIDFGIAREYKQNSIADTVALGTKGYAAPEQYGGLGQTDVRTDIYGIGVTLYHLLTGKNPSEPPYEICSIRQWNSNLSVELERIIKKCTQLNPENRYQSCNELMYDLRGYCGAAKISKREIVLFSFIKYFRGKFRKKRYINFDKFRDGKKEVNLNDAEYMAKNFSAIQNDERNCSTLKGPNYDE